MKTSKKLLSFFLAVVMAVTTCSVGFTAFAKSSKSDVFTQPADADETYNELVNIIYEYLPDILGLIGEDTLADAGISISKIEEADQPFYELMSELSPLLLGVLSGGGSQDDVLADYTSYYKRTYGKDISVSTEQKLFSFDYLEDENATMSFYSLYQFCLDNTANQNDDVKQYAVNTLAALRSMLDCYGNISSDITENGYAYAAGIDLLTSGEYLYEADASAPCDFGDVLCPYDLSQHKFYVQDESRYVALDDAVNTTTYGSALQDFVDYINLYVAGSCAEITTVSEALYYLLDNGGDALLISAIADAKLINAGGATITYDGATVNNSNFVSVISSKVDMETAIDGFYGITVDTNTYNSADAATKAKYDSMYNVAIQHIYADTVGWTSDSPNTNYFNYDTKGLLVESGLYDTIDDLNSAIESSEVTNAQLVAAHDYLSSNNVATAANCKTYLTGNNSPFSQQIKQYFNGLPEGDFSSIRINLIAGNYGTYANDWNKFIVSSFARGVFGTGYCNYGGTYNYNIDVIACYTSCLSAKSIGDQAKATGVSFEYDDFAVPSEISIFVVNSIINSYIDYLTSDDKILGDATIKSIVDPVLENLIGNNDITCEVLANNLYDVYINLANKPVETLLNLVPLLVKLIDDVVAPLLLVADDEVSSLPISIYNVLFQGGLIEFEIGGVKLSSLTQDAGNTEIGIGRANFDLNYILPALLNYMGGDDSYVTKTYAAPYDSTVPRITDIYVADKWIGEHLYSCDFTSGMAVGLQDIIRELVSFAGTASTDLYWGVYTDTPADADTCLAKGANDLLNAIPELINKLGTNATTKYNVPSDWTFGKEFNGTYGSQNIALDATATTTIENMFNVENNADKASAVFAELTNLIISGWIDALLDLLNDVISTDNAISSQIPIIQGLLQSLGGLGEESIITDILNGVFQLQRNEGENAGKYPCSFTLEEQPNGYVGLSVNSGYFVLANIDTVVNIVVKLVDSFSSNAKSSAGNSLTKQTSPVYSAATKSASGTSYAELLSKTNVKTAKELITKLDSMLSGVLSQSSINGYNLDETDNIFAAVISFVSNYIGHDNANYLACLFNSYCYHINGEDNFSSTSTGDVNDKDIYSDRNLTTIVVETYVLVENIVEYLLKDTGTITLKDVSNNDCNYNIIVEAIEGLISPDAVAIRMDNEDVANKMSSYNCWHDMITLVSTDKLDKNIGKTKVTFDYGITAGDKKAFYQGFAESFRIITSVLGVLLVDTGLYETTVQPVLVGLLSKVDEKGTVLGDVVTVSNSVYAPSKLIKGDGTTDEDAVFFAIITPLGALLDAFYAKPVTVLIELVQGLATILDDTQEPKLSSIIENALVPIDAEIDGLGNIVSNLSETYGKTIRDISLADKVNELIGPNEFNGAQLITIINNALKSTGIKLSKINYNKLSKATEAEALLLIFGYIIDNLADNAKVIGTLAGLTGDSSVKELLAMLSKIDANDIINIIGAVLDITQSPTEAYWTFYQYTYEKVYNFKYPLGITSGEANDAIGQVDELVANIFPLLNGLGVTDIEGLSALVNDNLYTNKLLTTIATAIYGALDGDIANYLKMAGIDVSTKGVAKILKDSSYGTTYSSAAKTLNSASSWKKVKTINWGFTDGSAKAQQGFIKGLAAIFRPFNDILAIFLADGNMEVGSILNDVVGNLKIDSSTVKLNKGILTVKVKGDDKKSTYSTIKVDLNAVLDELKDLTIYGTNGYESVIVPLLEAFMCDSVKTYKTYLKDYDKAKDNLLIDVLAPLFGFVNDVVEAPLDTISAVLPNVAYFIDSNGIAQVLSNLLAPITNVLSVMAKSNVNVDKIIKGILGYDLGGLLTQLTGTKITLKLSNLTTCNIQDALIPLVNLLLKDYKIELTNIDWSKLAGLGTVKTVKSAAKNSEGKYTTQQVTANQGQVLITVLRYVLDNVLDNMKPIKTLIKGIKMDSTIKNVINSVLTQLSTATSDDIIIAVFYFLTEEPDNSFWDYSDYQTKEYDFSYPEGVDLDFMQNLGPTIDGLVSGLVDLNSLVNDNLYTDSLINTIAKAMYQAIEGVNISDSIGSLTHLLAMTDIDFTTANVAKLLTDSDYGKTYSSAASIISKAGSWKNVNFDKVSWGVTDRDSFLSAICAVLRPIYGVLDVLLNDGSLGLFNLVHLPGSNGYTSSIVPLMEALSLYNIKTQYQYREDISKAYDNILLDILNPIFDLVEDLLNAPLQTLTGIVPNLALFVANDGVLQLINNLLTPIYALLDAVKPIVNVNDVLDAVGLSLGGLDIDVYDIAAMVEPYIGAKNIVKSLNSLLASIDIKGAKLNIVLNDIDWYQLASHGDVITNGTSQAATFGSRVYVVGDQAETLIAVLRYLINTIQSGNNLQVISNLISGLLGDNASESVSSMIDTVLGMLMDYKGDELIAQINDLLSMLAG